MKQQHIIYLTHALKNQIDIANISVHILDNSRLTK